MVRVSKDLPCPYCSLPCLTKPSLISHIDTRHLFSKTKGPMLEVIDINNTSIPYLIKCQLCERPIFSKAQFVDHQFYFHGITTYNGKFKTFPDIKSFKEWKSEIERKTVASFLFKVYEKKRTIRFYRCNREVPMTKKCDDKVGCIRYCSAYLRVKRLPNKTVEVEYCLEHYGHTQEPKYLKLSDLDRREVLSEIDKGLTDTQISKKIKEMYKYEKCRLSYLTVSAVRHIRENMVKIRKELDNPDLDWDNEEGKEALVVNGSVKVEEEECEETEIKPSMSDLKVRMNGSLENLKSLMIPVTIPSSLDDDGNEEVTVPPSLEKNENEEVTISSSLQKNENENEDVTILSSLEKNENEEVTISSSLEKNENENEEVTISSSLEKNENENEEVTILSSLEKNENEEVTILSSLENNGSEEVAILSSLEKNENEEVKVTSSLEITLHEEIPSCSEKNPQKEYTSAPFYTEQIPNDTQLLPSGSGNSPLSCAHETQGILSTDYDYFDDYKLQYNEISSSLVEMINRLKNETDKLHKNLNLKALKGIESDLSRVFVDNTIPRKRKCSAATGEIAGKRQRL